MAGDEVKRKSHHNHGDRVERRTRQSPEKAEDDNTAADDSIPTSHRPRNVDELRKARLAYLETPPEQKRKQMKSASTKQSASAPLIRAGSTKRTKATRHRSSEQGEATKHRRSRHKSEKKKVAREDDSENEYVYSRRPRREAHDEEADPPPPLEPERRRLGHQRIGDEARAPVRRHTEPVRHGDSRGMNQDLTDSATEHLPTPSRRSMSAVEKHQKPSLKRSTTSAKTRSEVTIAQPTADRPPRPRRGGSGIFGSFLVPHPPPPEKKVSCLTCGSDDVPISKSAKLPCTHRMCHSCLRRIFKLSVTDPAHMPPRCCTDKHIDLKHVDKLFDQEFKKTWNRKFEEYNTKNRIYCPARGCGEWIKPNHITTDRGRKVGKCKRCGTRVCGICNQKMHTTRDCPKDPATKQFVEVAKQEGWQRCYNCSAMVELKEGCNHMTCRCTAEFCMVCGLKWKSCDCPWFNYEAVDAHLGNPARYQEELDRRRDQERRDEVLARRMEALGIDDDGAQNWIFGLGNAAGHHMNQNFVQQAREALTANYQQAEQAARGLLNGIVMGRENRLPGFPLPFDETPQPLRPHPQRPNGSDPAALRPAPLRRATVRRRTFLADAGPDSQQAMGRGNMNPPI